MQRPFPSSFYIDPRAYPRLRAFFGLAVLALLALIFAFMFRTFTTKISNDEPIGVSIENTTVPLCHVNMSDIVINNNITAECPDNVTVNNFPTSIEVSNFPPQENVSVVVNCPENVTLADGSKVIIYGTGPDGDPTHIHVSPNGNLNVGIKDPRSAFGSVVTEQMFQIFQATLVYGINQNLMTPTVFQTGQVTAPENVAILTTGATSGSIATLQSRMRVNYLEGLGSRFIFSGKFDNVTADTSIQAMGPGTPEDGVFFSYLLGTFGILYTHRGKREIQDLTITTASMTDENVVVTLDDLVFNVPVTASGDIDRTVYEIANYQYAAWKAEPIGATVRFISDQATPSTGSFSLSATTAVGSFSLVRVGVVRQQEFYPQTVWNVDKLDGTGPSSALLHPEFFNVYMVSFQYAAAGPIRFYVELTTALPTHTDSQFVLVHQILKSNTVEVPNFLNPSFPFSAAIRNFAPTPTTVGVASFAGFVEGQKKYTGNRFSISNTITTVNSLNYQTLFTVRNARTVNGRANQGTITLMGVSGALKHGQPGTLLLFRSSENFQHELAGDPHFQYYCTNTGLLVDKNATYFTPTVNSQLVWSGEIAETSSVNRRFDDADDAITLQPGESLSLCGFTRAGIALWTAGSIDVREDA